MTKLLDTSHKVTIYNKLTKKTKKNQKLIYWAWIIIGLSLYLIVRVLDQLKPNKEQKERLLFCFGEQASSHLTFRLAKSKSEEAT